MPKLTVLPHAELAPEGVVLEVASGTSICEALLDHGIEIEHACEQSSACTTCHCIVRKSVTKALLSVDPQARIETDPPAREVRVDSEMDESSFLVVLHEAGYPDKR